MPRFEPFAGLRYAADIDLDAVIAPPFDVVSPEERVALSARHPANAIHVELPEDANGMGRDRYQQAAWLLRRWQEDGVLDLEDGPAFYGYRMRYRDDLDRHRQTTGVLGALGLSPPGEGEVIPHEQTMPKDKADRLELLRACRTNTSPVWGLSLARGLTPHIPPGDGASVTCTDDQGVVHELWPITDPGAVQAISATVGSDALVIADGHHRFATALTYRDERRGANGNAPGAYDLVMALVVELAEDQLSVRPIHRVISGLPAGFDVAAALSEHFEVVPGHPGDERLPVRMEKEQALALVTAKGASLLRPRPGTEAAADQPVDASRAAVALATLPPHHLTYQPSWHRALLAVEKGEAQAALLLRPASVEVIASVARRRGLMPPKTTFFHPKPRTGLVFRPVPG